MADKKRNPEDEYPERGQESYWRGKDAGDYPNLQGLAEVHRSGIPEKALPRTVTGAPPKDPITGGENPMRYKQRKLHEKDRAGAASRSRLPNELFRYRRD